MIDRLGRAGIEGQLLLLLRCLNRANVEPFVCLLDGRDERDSTALLDAGCHVLRLGVRSLLRPSTMLKALEFAKLLRHHRVDVVHPLFTDSLYFGAPAARLAGVPCVVRFRVDIGYWMTPIDRWVGRALSRIVDATMVNCEACRQTTIDREWAAPDSIAVIPNGVDLARFEPYSGGAISRRVETQRVGIVANLRPVKNLELFIRAAEIVASTRPSVQFEIAGEGDQRAPLSRLIEQLGLADRVTLVGSVGDVPAFLGRLDVAVLCSRSEGLPNAVMEYMAAGLPSVVTDVGGNRELIDHERHGLIVPSDDVEALAATIGRLLDDRHLAQRLGAAARRRALAEFGVDVQARRYEEFYHDLLQRKRSLG